jgi:predicted acyl esterase
MAWRRWTGSATSRGTPVASPPAGASYLGITQWALAAGAGPDLAAVVAAVTSSDPRAETYPGDGLALELALSWAQVASVQELRFGAYARCCAATGSCGHSIPGRIARADRLLLGKTVPFYQEWLARSAPGDPYWTPRVFSDEVAKRRGGSRPRRRLV